MKKTANTAEISHHSPTDGVEKPRKKNLRRTRPQLPMPEELDGRLNSVQVRDRLLARAKADLGGADQLSFIENEYTEAFVDLAIARRGLSASQLLGQPIDLTELTQTISSMVRVGSRLASQRRQRDVSPNLDQFLDARANTVEATVVSDDADEN